MNEGGLATHVVSWTLCYHHHHDAFGEGRPFHGVLIRSHFCPLVLVRKAWIFFHLLMACGASTLSAAGGVTLGVSGEACLPFDQEFALPLPPLPVGGSGGVGFLGPYLSCLLCQDSTHV